MTTLLRRVVTVDWPNKIQADGKALLLKTARDGHASIMANAAAQGLVPSWTAYANTPGNSDLDSVRLPGPIVYNYRYLSDLVAFAMEELERNSPRVSGEYVRNHTLYVNGAAVSALPSTISASDKIYIANPVPYSRKLEVGKRENGEPFVVQVEPRIYARTFEAVSAQAKGRAKVSYGFVDLGDVRSPAIFFTALI
ncbi:hypothetical protein [Bradyrhizobium sp. USDA 4545]|uniref:hypothetical protein n=1 Tax=Bradyrhizobium sp. USDA 4545 TaxID=2817705 RepID=UPI0020A3B2A5|nr:hypothetical protein [Bradyrhizobium sp. USDA 4545]MCP1832838.1 hypothetical protein [Bradyrhizobium sp. USDA 4545]